MHDPFTPPADQARLLLQVPLRPVQGDRFQPTGYPDLGPSRYKVNRGDVSTEVVLVESPQSMANHLESMCFDPPLSPRQPDPTAALAKCLEGMPFVRVDRPDGTVLTHSILEAHRLNSPYILQQSESTFFKMLQRELGTEVEGPIDLRKFAKLMFRYDPNSILHGVFLAEKKLAGGRYRLPRLLSGFIEATDAAPADYGGVKVNAINPKGVPGQDGSGNVIYHRTEFTGPLTAFFNFDLSMLRGYRLGEPAERFLIALAYFKIRRFLTYGLRLRTACDLTPVGQVEECPLEATTAERLTGAVVDCRAAGLFAEPAVTVVVWGAKAASAGALEIELPSDFPPPSPFKGALKKVIEFKPGKRNKPTKLVLKQGLTAELLALIEKDRPAESRLLEVLKSKLASPEG